MGPDGKPCKICTAFRNWQPGTGSNTEPDTGREKARVANAASRNNGRQGSAGRGAMAAMAGAAGAGATSGEGTREIEAIPASDGRLQGPPADCPADVEVLGRATWTFLHTTAAYYPDKPTPTQRANMLMLIRSLPVVYPCTHCAQDFGKCIDHSPPDVSSRTKLSLWLCQRHNEVNEKLGKAIFDCAKVDERWKDGPADGRCD